MGVKELEIENILVINLASTSEVALSVPVVRALREHYPGAKITLLVHVQSQDVAEMIPYADEAIGYDINGEHQGVSGFISLINLVRGGAFDLAVAMNRQLREAFIAWAAGVKYRVGYEGRFNKVFLTHTAEEDDRVRHQTIAYLQVLAPLNVTTDDTSLTLCLDENAEKIVDVTMFLHQERPNVVFCPLNLNRTGCRLREETILAIVKELSSVSNVYLIGGVKEQPFLTAAAKEAGLPPERVLAGKLNLKEIAVFLKYTKVMLTVEACTMYMAQAFNIPVVALFGKTNSLIYGPCGNRDVVLTRKSGGMADSGKEKHPDEEGGEIFSVEDIIGKVTERLK